MKHDSHYLERLRLITPVLMALSMFLIAAIWNDINKLSDKMEGVKERLATLEAQIKLVTK